MIARIWRGNTRREHAEEYGRFLERKGFSDYRATPGNRGALLLQRRGEESAEFVLISFWEDFDAVRRFAGQNPEKAVYYPEDEHYLLGKEPNVAHYEVAPASLPEMARWLGAQEVGRSA
ncbi:MAG TPA: antibiotic biosynthesis monooxygenase [Thermoanaerobaculia bacterium]|nr:antibiotic biosynthesis monooxygenase [Thermoanaerobaculia bacterium]